MIIGGFQRFSLIDYPGKTCAVIFTRGCGFRCKYCHNPELVIPEKYSAKIGLESIMTFLEGRRNKLDAVTISGGEPTDQIDIEPVIGDLKRMEFLIKLDTNGTRPEVLKSLIEMEMIDYVAMDVKGPFEKYEDITGCYVDTEKIKESIDIVLNSGVDHEFRTTVASEILSEEDLLKIAMMITGAKRYYLQTFTSSKMICTEPSALSPLPIKDMQSCARKIRGYVKDCRVR